jgi:membrane associated rhomboid family serine protease
VKLLDRLERRFGSWAIPQFALFIVMANGLIYLLALAKPAFIGQLLLDPAAVRAGQFWRLITFLFVPPMLTPLFMVFWLLLVYQFAQALEQEWGEFKFCLFYAIGGLATIIAAVALQATLSNVALNLTLFLAFATLFPDYQLLLFFFIPGRVKYLAWFAWAGVAWGLVTGSTVSRVAIVASLVNYVFFFGSDIAQSVRLRWDVHRNRKRFKP